MNDLSESSGNSRLTAGGAAWGPLSVFAVLALVALDLAFASWANTPAYESWIVGLSFGQTGAAIVWLFARARPGWSRLVAICTVAALMGLYNMYCMRRGTDLQVMAMLLSIYLTFAGLATCLCFVVRWIRHQQQSAASGQVNLEAPRFGVRHLLIVTTLLAVVSMMVRYAIPEFAYTNQATIVVWVVQSAVLVAIAVQLCQQSISLHWQFAGLAVAAVVGAALMTVVIDWEDAIYASAVQVAVLALAIIVVHLDRPPEPLVRPLGRKQ